MWYYKFYKFAATKEDFLKSININEDIINFILSQNEKIVDKLIRYIYNNQNATIEDLMEVIKKENKKKNNPTRLELGIASRFKEDPIFYEWVLNQLKKHRIHPEIISGIFEYNFTNLGINSISEIEREFGLIYDWYRINQVNNIKDYSMKDAFKREQEWHKSLQEEGSELYYSPIKPENIVYGPKWKNKQWDGWTIQRVGAEDVKCEGNRMHNCVGSYYNEVLRGDVRVFSLRDPENKPHATIGMYEEGNNCVFDYKGVNNSFPSGKEKEMVKEWFISLGNVQDCSGLTNEEYDDPKDLSELNDLYSKIINKKKKEKEERLNPQLLLEIKDFDDFGFIKEDNKYNFSLNNYDYSVLKSYINNQPKLFLNQRSINRYNIQEVDAAIANLLELSFLLSLEQISKIYNGREKLTQKYIENIYFNRLLNDLYSDYENLLSDFDENYVEYRDLEYFDDMTDEEVEEALSKQYDEELKEYFNNSDIGYIVKEFFDQIKKNPNYKNFQSLYIDPLIKKEGLLD